MNLNNLLMVARMGTALRNVPHSERNYEVCKVALLNNGRALEFVPHNLITEEFARIAVEQDAVAIEHVPPQWRSADLYKRAVARYPGALLHVPPQDVTVDLLQLALSLPAVVRQYLAEHGDYLEYLDNTEISNWIEQNKQKYIQRIM